MAMSANDQAGKLGKPARCAPEILPGGLGYWEAGREGRQTWQSGKVCPGDFARTWALPARSRPRRPANLAKWQSVPRRLCQDPGAAGEGPAEKAGKLGKVAKCAPDAAGEEPAEKAGKLGKLPMTAVCQFANFARTWALPARSRPTPANLANFP